MSYQDVEELLTERGIEVDHVTVYRWVQRFVPLLADAARSAYRSAGDRWFVDETYVKVNGVWRYVYRAIDQHGEVIDVQLSSRRAGHHRETTRRAGQQRAHLLSVVGVSRTTRTRLPASRVRTAPPELQADRNPLVWHPERIQERADRFAGLHDGATAVEAPQIDVQLPVRKTARGPGRPDARPAPSCRPRPYRRSQ
jgi:IS6 family transposase